MSCDRGYSVSIGDRHTGGIFLVPYSGISLSVTREPELRRM